MNTTREETALSSPNQLVESRVESRNLKDFKNKDNYSIMVVKAVVGLIWQKTKGREPQVRRNLD